MLLHLSPGQRWSEGDKRDEEGYKQDECDALRSMNMQLREKCQSLQQEVNSLRLERDFFKEKVSNLSISSETFIVTDSDEDRDKKKKN